MKPQNVAALAASGQATPIAKTRKELLETIQGVFYARRTEDFKTLPNLEDMNLEKLRATSTAGNVFDVFAKTLNDQGVPTKQNLGSIMDNLSLNQAQIHHLACFCTNGEQINGGEIAKNIEYVDLHGDH